jgi:hypothetical protein
MKKKLHDDSGSLRPGIDRLEDVWKSSERDPRAAEERGAWVELAGLNPLDEHWRDNVLVVAEKIRVSSEWRLERLRKVVRMQDVLGALSDSGWLDAETIQRRARNRERSPDGSRDDRPRDRRR